MTIEIAAASLLQQAAPATGAAGAGASVQAGYGVSLTDLGGFQQALANAGARLEAKPALQITAEGQAAQAAGKEITPGQMVMLTAKCQEFMFHAQLMSSVANKTSDGLSQLFRQQS
jgi:hypothetical protein